MKSAADGDVAAPAAAAAIRRRVGTLPVKHLTADAGVWAAVLQHVAAPRLADLVITPDGSTSDTALFSPTFSATHAGVTSVRVHETREIRPADVTALAGLKSLAVLDARVVAGEPVTVALPATSSSFPALESLACNGALLALVHALPLERLHTLAVIDPVGSRQPIHWRTLRHLRLETTASPRTPAPVHLGNLDHLEHLVVHGAVALAPPAAATGCTTTRLPALHDIEVDTLVPGGTWDALCRAVACPGLADVTVRHGITSQLPVADLEHFDAREEDEDLAFLTPRAVYQLSTMRSLQSCTLPAIAASCLYAGSRIDGEWCKGSARCELRLALHRDSRVLWRAIAESGRRPKTLTGFVTSFASLVVELADEEEDVDPALVAAVACWASGARRGSYVPSVAKGVVAAPCVSRLPAITVEAPEFMAAAAEAVAAKRPPKMLWWALTKVLDATLAVLIILGGGAFTLFLAVIFLAWLYNRA
ncbi:hypothetical protein H9P43_004281 [Blastocladiella emersonii ATCC 22665]|nr:hypothetical protein H9P43_004281 [Blastocladiella emersonii ATCC 22665]